MQHEFQCGCGRLRGVVRLQQRPVRGVCYCNDCQAYARLTGQEALTLDASGGTEVVATQARCVVIQAGKDWLRCHSLSDVGLLRWYAGCCGTPIANTLRNRNMPYVGVHHRCLGPAAAREAAFGRVSMHVNRSSARAPVAALRLRKFAALARFVPALLLGRMTGSYRQSAFFNGRGEPVSPPEVILGALKLPSAARSPVDSAGT